MSSLFNFFIRRGNITCISTVVHLQKEEMSNRIFIPGAKHDSIIMSHSTDELFSFFLRSLEDHQHIDRFASKNKKDE